jgi:hypothetical protein
VTIPEGMEPLAVWDAGDPEWRDGIFSERFFWLSGSSPIVHVYRTQRIEFYLLDAPFAVVHRYALTDGGEKYQGGDYMYQEDGSPVMEPPVIVPLAELPPEHLLR